MKCQILYLIIITLFFIIVLDTAYLGAYFKVNTRWEMSVKYELDVMLLQSKADYYL